MDISEGKEALEKIQELEKQIEERLNQVRQEAKDIVSSARSKAEEIVQDREGKLTALRQSLTEFRSKDVSEPHNIKSPDIKLDDNLIQNLAEDFFKLLTKT